MLDHLRLDGLHRLGLIETLTQDSGPDVKLHTDFGPLVGYPISKRDCGAFRLTGLHPLGMVSCARHP